MKIAEQQLVKKLTDDRMIERIMEFRKYLHSSKFHQDTTIQVWEVDKFLKELNEYIDNSKPENIYSIDSFKDNLYNNTY